MIPEYPHVVVRVSQFNRQFLAVANLQLHFAEDDVEIYQVSAETPLEAIADAIKLAEVSNGPIPPELRLEIYTDIGR